jgi:hypothetical protein
MKKNAFPAMPTLPGGSVGLAVLLLAVAIALLVWAANLSRYVSHWRPLLVLSSFGFLAAAVCGLWALVRPLQPSRGRLAERAAWCAVFVGGLGFSTLYCGLSQGGHHLSRNESATIGDIRTLISAQHAYQSADGEYFAGDLSCLARPRRCIPGYPADAPVFLDETLASLALKSGYERSFHPGLPPEEIRLEGSPTGVRTWAYIAIPTAPGYSGVRSFCGDQTGEICNWVGAAALPLSADGTCDLTRCDALD